MARRNSAIQLMMTLMMAVLVASCARAARQTAPTFGFRPTLPVLPIPADVRRVAVLYPRGETPEWSSVYGRLEVAAFQFKAFRPDLRIIDRSHMPTLVSEQCYHISGLASEKSAVRIGRILGADSMLTYLVNGPTLRDRLFAHQHHNLPPMTVTSKITRVESGEAVYRNVVTAHVDETERSG